jgi:hypothetical protein
MSLIAQNAFRACASLTTFLQADTLRASLLNAAIRAPQVSPTL